MAAPGLLTGAAILVAGGAGTRLGSDRPKAFVELAGATLLEHAASRFRPGVARVEMLSAVVVAPAGFVDLAHRLTGLRAVVGGVTRQQSVAAGLAALPDVDFVLVHDVARPFVPAAVIDAVLTALAGGAHAVVPVVPIHDTVRRIDNGVLGGLVDRSKLVAMQTPQGFRRDLLVEAHANGAGLDATDDAALAENLGVEVVAVPGSEDSFKITTATDLVRAEALAGRGEPAPPTGDTAANGLG